MRFSRPLHSRLFAVMVVAVSVALSGCGGGATSAAHSPTAVVSSTPSALPTSSPSPTQPATTAVFYDISTAWIPYGNAQDPKRTRVTLVFQQVRSGAKPAARDRLIGPEITHSPRLNAASPLALAPGKYEAIRIIFPRNAFGTKKTVEIALLNGKGQALHGPTFTVPAADCVYIGFLVLTFVRVEPTHDTAGQLALIQKVSPGTAMEATILLQGSVLLFVNDRDTIHIGLDRKAQRKVGAANCKVSAWKDPLA